MRYKFTKKSDIDKLDTYLKYLLHMLANKPLSEIVQSNFYKYFFLQAKKHFYLFVI